MPVHPWLSPALSMTLFKEETMLVHPVVIPGSGTLSWTVLGGRRRAGRPGRPVPGLSAPISAGRRTRSRPTAHDLKDYWDFLGFRGLDWREARLEDIGEFVALAAAAPGGPVRRCRGAAVRGGRGHGGDGEPQARRGERVLRAPGPQRSWGRRLAGRVEDWRAGRLEAVPAPCQQGQALSRPGHLAQGAEEAAADPDRRRDAGDPGCLHAAAGPFLLRLDARDRLPGRRSTRPPP